jgi:hypothetical protein
MMPAPQVSFCKTVRMSFCTARSSSRQRNCRFYRKATSADRCMFFVFNEYCDCPDAQRKARENRRRDS